MFRSRLIALASLLSLLAIIFGTFSAAGAQTSGKGRLIAAYAAGEGQAPVWAAKAEAGSLAHLESKGYSRQNFTLRRVDQDDLGVNARFDQTYNGVSVFGGQIVVHSDLDGKAFDTSGYVFDVNGVSTKPSISSAQAIKTARAALGYRGAFEKESAKLVIYPNGGSAALAYQVSLHVEADQNAIGHHEYFINAQTGAQIAYYNDIDYVNATGSGKSLYSGTVSIGTDLVSGVYYLRDNTRGGMYTNDMKNRTSGSGTTFSDADNVWGTGTTSSGQSAAVDAHFGTAVTWDYYLSTFNRRGIDGNGFRVLTRVHYGRNYNNAFWNGSNMTYGDGDGSTFTPLTSIDVAGHEITHGLTEKTAGLVYSYESGATNEAMSDIFGTMVEFYSGKNPDYLIGEDIYTPATAGDALRSMSNPGAFGDPDHYSKRYTGSQDNGGVHTNSGIVNQAFYLLANGGTNRTSGLSVSGIGNAKAAAIYYRTLTVYLTSSSNFSNVRAKSLQAATDLYGAGSVEYNAVQASWTAVGVN